MNANMNFSIACILLVGPEGISVLNVMMGEELHVRNVMYLRKKKQIDQPWRGVMPYTKPFNACPMSFLYASLLHAQFHYNE